MKQIRKRTSFKKIKENREQQNALLFALFQAVQSSLDIANHIVADLEIRRPESSAEIFKILGEGKVIHQELVESMRELANLRNQIVHLYGSVDIEETYRRLKKYITSLKSFEKYVVEFLKKILNINHV